MTNSTQILNWLIIGFEQATGSMNENFYYDKRDKEFFSILAIDYFMLDEDLNVGSNVSTSYTKNQESSLLDRIKRIEFDDPNIIPIPRVSLEERKHFMHQFVDTLSDLTLIKNLNQEIINQDFRSEFDFNFRNGIDDLTKQKWKELKIIFLQQQVESFLNINDIDIDNTSLWIVDAKGSISIDFTKDN